MAWQDSKSTFADVVAFLYAEWIAFPINCYHFIFDRHRVTARDTDNRGKTANGPVANGHTKDRGTGQAGVHKTPCPWSLTVQPDKSLLGRDDQPTFLTGLL